MKLGVVGGVAMVSMAALLVGPAYSFEGKSVAASDCSYGGKIKSIVATDQKYRDLLDVLSRPGIRGEGRFRFVRYRAVRTHREERPQEGPARQSDRYRSVQARRLESRRFDRHEPQ